MKNRTVTNQVMKKVIRFEEKRSSAWYTKFWVFLFIIFISIVYVTLRIVVGYQESDAAYMTSWYFSDWEIFQIVWRDAFEFVWSLLPQYWVFLGIVGAIIFFLSIMFTKRKRIILKKRLESIQILKKEDV